MGRESDDSALCHAGSPGDEAATKRRRTVARGRDFVVKIEFAAKIRMTAIEEMMRGVMGRNDLELEVRALDALRVLDIVLRESASERYVDLQFRLSWEIYALHMTPLRIILRRYAIYSIALLCCCLAEGTFL